MVDILAFIILVLWSTDDIYTVQTNVFNQDPNGREAVMRGMI